MTLASGASNGDKIAIIVYDVFNVTVDDAYSKTTADSRFLNVAGDTMSGALDLNGVELVLDADADTSITADTDDQIDIKIAGADDFQFTANTFTAQSGSTIAAQALTATTITASGIVKTDDTTEATSTTDGSLQTDGGLSVAKDAVFGDDVKFWLGRVVSYSAQEEQANGTASWGWRYKVRVFGAYADDEVTDSDVVYATCMIPNTAGTGAAGGYKTLRISQGDTVFGFYMAPDDGFPVIIGSLGRTDATKDNPQVLSGFTAEKKPGLIGRQEANEKDGPNIPTLDASAASKGSGKGKAVNTDAISSQLGIDPNEEPKVNAIKNPPTPKTAVSYTHLTLPTKRIV